MSKEKYQKQWEAISQRIEKAVRHTTPASDCCSTASSPCATATSEAVLVLHHVYLRLKLLMRLRARSSQNSELLCLTYGSLVSQLLKDFEHVEAINQQLEKMYEA
ncbi:trafficking protein particle complex subunit [Cyclospora cayetanensis]|uniref:Trafficking protein particle complex subunit n=1 Tax=Cyclospora cayetanensis TaxID=88456 RepID=A0A1D3D0R6_9EIME|nr:trafficking protein particle complex subunit [Cyclospora cayetanensis]